MIHMSKKSKLLLGLASALLLITCRHKAAQIATETFTVTNLVVTADATITRTNTPEIVFTTGTNPQIITCNASPPTSVTPVGSLCIDTVGNKLYQSAGAGSWAQVGGGTTTGSIAITTFAAGDLDMSTVGTYDWLFSEALATNKNTWNAKATGGWLLDSFEYILPSGGTTSTDSRGWIFTAANTDDVVTGGFSGTRTFYGPNGADKVRAGFRFRIPTSPTPRVLKWEGTMFSALTTVSASIDCPGAATPQTLAVNTASGSGLDYGVQITYSGPAGCWLLVTHVINTVQAGGANLYVSAIAST